MATTTTQKSNLVMVDFAVRDPRSVSAGLRGNGDGREVVWEKFRTQISNTDPLLSDEDISYLYSQKCKVSVQEKRSSVRPIKLSYGRVLRDLLIGAGIAILLL